MTASPNVLVKDITDSTCNGGDGVSRDRTGRDSLSSRLSQSRLGNWGLHVRGFFGGRICLGIAPGRETASRMDPISA